MNGISATIFCHPHQLLDIEIALAWRRTAQGDTLVGEKRMRGAGIRLRVDRDRRNAHFAAGPHHPKSDLAAVGDEDLVEDASLGHRQFTASNGWLGLTTSPSLT